MDRGRSPSVAQHHASKPHSRSPSAHTGFNHLASARGTDPVLPQQGGSSFTSTFPPHPNSDQTSLEDTFNPSSYLSSDLSQTFTQEPSISNQSFMQDFGGQTKDSFQYPTYGQQQHDGLSNGMLDPNSFQGLNSQYLDADNTNHNQQLDPSFLFEPASPADQHPKENQSTEPSFFSNVIGDIPQSIPQSTANLYQESALSSTENSPMGGNMNQFQNTTPTRSRAQSLDPSSAAFPQHGQMGSEWTSMGSYGGHHRQPSDAVSDASSNPSPYIPDADSFEPMNGNSPLFNEQRDAALTPEMLGLNQFSLSDPQYPQPQHFSPGQSLHNSPRLSPDQNLPQFTSGDDFGLLASQPHFGGGSPGPQFFDVQESFPSIHQTTSGGAMSNAGPTSTAPAIEINLAPAQDKQQHLQNESRPQPRRDSDALHPPSRSTTPSTLNEEAYANLCH